jgi:hypothetical protein
MFLPTFDMGENLIPDLTQCKRSFLGMADAKSCVQYFSGKKTRLHVRNCYAEAE